MARMIPYKMINDNPSSREIDIWKSLKFNLPSDYTVYHSFKITKIVRNSLYEGETDFIIFHPKKGLLFIEAKHGEIRWNQDRTIQQKCFDKTGVEFWKQIDPFYQASKGAHNLRELCYEHAKTKEVPSRCKFLPAVWFHSISREQIDIQTHWPEKGSSILTLSLEDLDNPLPKIEEIFNLDPEGLGVKTNLSEADCFNLRKEVICPYGHLTPKKNWKDDETEEEFIQLLQEQQAILDFLSEQKTVAVSGAAGTGKTLVAEKKAEQLAELEEKVLFLCFNKLLQKDLSSKYKNKFIDFYTLDKFQSEKLGCLNYTSAAEKLARIYDNLDDQPFEYKHVIIDEGQDFGLINENNAPILKWLYDIIEYSNFGTFYIFYDEFQLVNGVRSLPSFITNAECKVTLHKNCRNTTEIANASFKPMYYAFLKNENDIVQKAKIERRLKKIKGLNNGLMPTMSFVDSDEMIRPALDKILTHWISEQNDDKAISPSEIVILTCKSEKYTKFQNEMDREYYLYKGGTKIKFSNCSKFKGLEAKGIILIEVNKSTFTDLSYTRSYYVGTSRAKERLAVICTLTEDDCSMLVTEFNEEPQENTYKEDVSSFLKCDYKKV